MHVKTKEMKIYDQTSSFVCSSQLSWINIYNESSHLTPLNCPSCIYCKLFSSLLTIVAPNITSFLVPRLAQLGMNATLTCAVSGIPQPGITWYRDSVSLSVTSNVFVIDNVTEADGGVYTCIASNAAGMKSQRGNLTVQG